MVFWNEEASLDQPDFSCDCDRKHYFTTSCGSAVIDLTYDDWIESIVSEDEEYMEYMVSVYEDFHGSQSQRTLEEEENEEPSESQE